METLESMLLRRPRPGPLNQSGSVMTQAPQEGWKPEYEKEPPLEQVSPEDFIPNPKTAIAALKGMPLVAGTFLGKNSPLWDPNRAAAAELRLAGGEAPESVWRALRTGRLPEGQMTQEISDAGTKVDLAKLNSTPALTYHAAPDVIKGPVMGVHPDFQNYLIQMNPNMKGVGGRHWATKKLIELNPKMVTDPDTATSVILHELGGHATQNRMGYHGGGVPKFGVNIDPKQAFKNYRDIYGEAMARLIQGRHNLSRSQISEQYPFDPDYFKQVTGSAINELRRP